MDTKKCRVCDRPLSTEFARYPELSRITSDCRSFREGGRLFVCDCCGAVQKIVDEKWLQEIGEIYAAYSVYEQGGGEEQKAVDPQTGELVKRSDIIAARLGVVLSLTAGDTILDVGCGNGATLEALSKRFPACVLYGSELNDSTQPALASIAGFRRLYTAPVQEIGKRFELVCMVHSLEHFENPLAQLKSTLPLLSERGHLFIEVCNVRENPFDLLVADHLMHFSADSLSHLLTLAGYEVLSMQTNWVGKELSALARPSQSESAKRQLEEQLSDRSIFGANELSLQYADIVWLADFTEQIKAAAKDACARGAKFGVFGTSIAASWVAGFLGDSIDFFVDEDENRIGKTFFGKPVKSPAEVDEDSHVFVALTTEVSKKITERLSDYKFKSLMYLP